MKSTKAEVKENLSCLRGSWGLIKDECEFPIPSAPGQAGPGDWSRFGTGRSVRVPAVCLCEPGPEGKQQQPACTVPQWSSEQRAAVSLSGDLRPLNGSPLLQNS